VIDTQDTMTGSQFALDTFTIVLPAVAFLVWIYSGRELRRWWRRRNLNIPNEEENVRTITGPLWEVTWIKVSEITEKRPDDQRSTVLGNTLPEVMQVLKAKYGDEFDEKNVRSADKRSYSNVIVGIPDTVREGR
jgi:hypothetical protein